MKIYTRTGDEGTTALFGGGRVPKTHSRIAAYGTVDETNAYIGLARAFSAGHPKSDRLDGLLAAVQEDLFILGADLATPEGARPNVPRVAMDHVDRLEGSIDELEADLPPLKHFILPGGTQAAAVLHVARTVCRRAERLVLRAGQEEDVSPTAAIYLNRLSDFLFVVARWANRAQGGEESTWSPRT